MSTRSGGNRGGRDTAAVREGGAHRYGGEAAPRSAVAKEQITGRGTELEYTGKHGIVRVIEHGEEGYDVVHFPTREHQRLNVGQAAHVLEQGGVTRFLRKVGYANTFDHGILHPSGATASKSAVGKGSKPAKGGALSRGANWQNARTGTQVGQYDVNVADHDMTLTRQPGGTFRISDTDRISHKTSETTLASAKDAQQYLASHGAKASFAKTIVTMADQDMKDYLEKTPTPAQQARIAATTARRAALDRQFGQYTDERARSHVQAILDKHTGLEEAIYSHLFGGSYFSPKSITDTIKTEMPGSKVSTRSVEAAFKQLKAVSEWSILHSPNITREGTVRLWHGTNGTTSPAQWRARLASSGEAMRATPFTTNYRVAAHFAEKGPHGRTIVSAHVPASSVLFWWGISNSQSWADEQEYTVGGGGISDASFVKVPGNIE